MLSGDVELNPGPAAIICDESNNTFDAKLNRLGLRPLDVGGGGDCFFKAVSHQLYGDASQHWDIRAAGV